MHVHAPSCLVFCSSRKSNSTQGKPASGSGVPALGTSSFASFLSLGPEKGITALLFEEMIREGKHYISIMKGVRDIVSGVLSINAEGYLFCF